MKYFCIINAMGSWSIVTDMNWPNLCIATAFKKADADMIVMALNSMRAAALDKIVEKVEGS